MSSSNLFKTASTRRLPIPAGATRRAIAMVILAATALALGGCFYAGGHGGWGGCGGGGHWGHGGGHCH